jgi:hypothetical protein
VFPGGISNVKRRFGMAPGHIGQLSLMKLVLLAPSYHPSDLTIDGVLSKEASKRQNLTA